MTSSDLSQRIDTIERAYEYLLAYAAQGRQNEVGTEARVALERMHEALDGLAALAAQSLQGTAEYDLAPFMNALDNDARIARSAVALVLSRGAISSLLVDNLNASVHLRALLTDLFLLEQALKSR